MSQAKVVYNTCQNLMTLDDVASDAAHLSHLLDVLVEEAINMPRRSDGSHIDSLDRVAALLWVARDVSEKLSGDVSIANQRLTCERKNSCVCTLATEGVAGSSI